MEIKERTESFDSITSTDSYSFEDDLYFGEGGRDRSSSIAFMMETVKYIERKTRPAWDRGSLTPSRASTDSVDSDHFCVSEISASAPEPQHPKQRLRSKSKSFAPSLRKSPSILKIQNERSKKRLKRGNSETFKNSWDFPLVRTKKLNTKREIAEDVKPQRTERSNTISLYIEESAEGMSEQEASWMNYLNEGTHDHVQWLPCAPGSTERNVQAATLGWLIKNMVVSLDGKTDKDEFIDVMILTHSIFVAPLELFDKLESYYWTTSPILTLDRESYLHKSVTKSDLERKFRVFLAFKKWTDYHDLQEDDELVSRLERFIRILRKSPRPLEITWSRDLKESLNKKPPLSPGIKQKLPKFIRTGFLTIRKVDVKHVNILDIDTMDLVRHLTSSDWKLFKRIKPKELLKKSWSFPDKDTHSPNVVKLIESFNRISHWVATEILMTSNPKMRVKVLEKFVEVLKGLKSVQNFHGIFSIYAALNMNCIQRLTSLWEEISPKHIACMREVEKLIHPRSNFKTYRNTLKKLQLPYIPFEGLFLQDITFIEENPDKLENTEMINFEKMVMLRKILHVLKIVQSTPYKFKESGFINDYLKASPRLTEEEMYKISKSIRIAENQHSMDGSVFKKLQHLLH